MFNTEADLENHIRGLIKTHIVSKYLGVNVLKNKGIGDIIICRDCQPYGIFFIEVKLYRQYQRIGIGGSMGEGIQPEILNVRPKYLDSNLRWLIGQSDSGEARYWFVSSETVCNYLMGGGLGRKQNNIQEALTRDTQSISEADMMDELKYWLSVG